MKICFRLQFGTARFQAKNKFAEKNLQISNSPGFDTHTYACVHVYIFAGAFLQFMNSNISSVLIHNGVQRTFLIEIHAFFYFWE